MNNLILEFMEKWTTLHFNVEVDYVVDGYELTIMRDGDAYMGPFSADTIENCFITATRELIK